MESHTETTENIPYVLDDADGDLKIFERRKAELLAQLAAVGKTPVPDLTALFNASNKLNIERKKLCLTRDKELKYLWLNACYAYKHGRDHYEVYEEYEADKYLVGLDFNAKWAAADAEYQNVAARFPEPKY